MMTRKAILFILGIGIVVAAAGAASRLRHRRPLPDGMQYVSWAMHACYGLNRMGEQTTTVKAGDKQITSRVEVAYRRPGMHYLHYLDGPLRGVQVWEDLHRVYRYQPGKDRLEVSPAEPKNPLQLERRLDLMQKNYSAAVEGDDVIAGRAAYRIALRPRHPGNPWKRLWIDRESFLMLGSEDYDSHDHLLRDTRFASLSLDTEPEVAFQPKLALVKKATWNPEAEGAPLPPQRIARRVGFEILLPKYVPPGYRFVGTFLDKCECGLGDNAARSQYTDGLNTISVFQCGHPCAHGKSCWVSGAPQGVAVRVAHGPDNFMFVGEIDRSELEKMSQSVPPRR